MAKFKALYSKTQTFSFNGTGYQFSDGYFRTKDEDLINFLIDNHGCELIDGELSIKKPSTIVFNKSMNFETLKKIALENGIDELLLVKEGGKNITKAEVIVLLNEKVSK